MEILPPQRLELRKGVKVRTAEVLRSGRILVECTEGEGSAAHSLLSGCFVAGVTLRSPPACNLASSSGLLFDVVSAA